MTSNPFATRFTAPGNVPYLGEAGLCARLHDTWLKLGRVGAIFGPHGSGKSTLLATLEQAWAREYGYRLIRATLHDGQRTLPGSFRESEIREHDLLIIDGYEQLGWRARWSLQRLRRRKSCGLLITAHEASRLPTLERVEPDFPTFFAVVRCLLEPLNDSTRTEEFLSRHARTAWESTGGNARETLFRLFDRWEVETSTTVKLARL